jgi:hypothetical protein
MGARLKVVDGSAGRGQTAPATSLDVRTDRKGEYFEIRHRTPPHAQLILLDVRPDERHLLLMVRERGEKHKFLCGHDERHWFVAAIPDTAAVGNVRQAMESLKPGEVIFAQKSKRLRSAQRNRRKNAAFVRQGEWFFVPATELVVKQNLVLPDEPLSRGNGGKPHWAEFCYRSGGETVYVCGRHPTGVTIREYQRIVAVDPQAKRWGWRAMRRNAEVYVQGRIRHTDHATIKLNGWHRVFMNTESRSSAMKHVAFLD